MARHDKQHGLGAAADHSSATLAELNALVSDATLDDSSATRTPATHASSHQDGGGDEISVAGLSGLLADNQNPTAHATEHVDGTDDIQDATAAQKGLATAAQITKLDGIEALADVTDATNVDAAGATMNTDSTLAGNSYFLDEDNMASDDATKVASQQSIKAYVDGVVAAAIVLQGDWNASTNTPDITTTTTTGHAWRVSVAGSTDLGGITDWAIGDLAVKTASSWLKIDNSDIAAVWGNITGTLSNQTDLQSALDGKASTSHAATHTNGTDDIQDATASVKGLATAAQITKLDGIEALADVTDATNVNAAGATMNTDTTLAGNSYFLDEDNMASDDATKVASQQSIKAYVDSNAATFQVVSAAGATPVDSDVSAWANDTFGVVVGTGGRVWHTFKNATDVYFVEMNAN